MIEYNLRRLRFNTMKRREAMDALLIKSIIFSQEPDTPETEGSSNAVMVPDPDSEYGYKV